MALTFLEFPTDVIMGRLREEEVPAAQVNSIDEVLIDINNQHIQRNLFKYHYFRWWWTFIQMCCLVVYIV